ncbi:MAG: amino acid ABC transporter substrate-binding protein [Clostridia bacterium]|nr:amino acid ABC transporter substrate-binding protein [Clostridia bacterium]
MKKVLSVILAVVLLVSAVALVSCGKKEETKTLKVYTNAGFAPYEYVDENGKVVGVDIDVMNYIGEKLGYKVVINDIEFKAILNEVQKDEFAVGAAGMSKNDERDAVALASEIYATSVQYVIAPAGTFADGAIVSIADVVAYAAAEGKAIGDQEATTGSFLVEDAVADTEVQQVNYTNAIVASTDIGTTLAAVVIDKLPAQSICSGKADLSCWELDEEPESYVLYFNKNATELVKEVNELLKKMIADGTIDQFTVNHSSGK